MVRYEALKQAREQVRTLKESYSWLQPEQAPQLRTFVESYQRDPVNTLVQALNELAQHPQYGPQLQALIGAGGGGADNDPEPAPDYRTPDGDEVRSAKNQAEWYEWKARRDRKQFSEQLQPLQSYVESQRQKDSLAEMKTKADARAKAIFEPYLNDPHFQEHRADIKARFQEYLGDMPGEAALHRAYNDILREKVIPTLSTTERTAVVRSLQQKPGATGINPARPTAAAAPRKRHDDFRSAAEAILG